MDPGFGWPVLKATPHVWRLAVLGDILYDLVQRVGKRVEYVAFVGAGETLRVTLDDIAKLDALKVSLTS